PRKRAGPKAAEPVAGQAPAMSRPHTNLSRLAVNQADAMPIQESTLMPQKTVVRALARSRCGGYVLLRRAAGDRFAGRWELPGGTVEAGEPLELAVARELREEAGLVTVAPPALLASTRRRSPRGTPLHEHCFRVEAGGDPSLSHEHDAFCVWQP